MNHKNCKRWTEEEIEFIRENYRGMSYREIASRLPGRTRTMVKSKAVQLKLDREPKIDDRYSSLEIISERFVKYNERQGCNISWVHVRCLACGKELPMELTHVVKEVRDSCGCLGRKRQNEATTKAKTTHGKSSTRIYGIWLGIKQRCTNENHTAAHNYVGRGISMCDEWLNSFELFYEWSIKNGYKDDLTIDRIDNDKGYSPDNCRWADYITQGNNTRWNKVIEAFGGEKKTLAEWSRDERCIASYDLLKQRLNHGWQPERAMKTPPQGKGNRGPKMIEAFGETKTAAEWARDPRCKVCYGTLKSRIDRDAMPPEEAISTPFIHQRDRDLKGNAKKNHRYSVS